MLFIDHRGKVSAHPFVRAVQARENVGSRGAEGHDLKDAEPLLVVLVTIKRFTLLFERVDRKFGVYEEWV